MVIARYSKFRAGAFVIAFLAYCGWLFARELNRPAGTPIRDFFLSNHPFTIIALLISPLAMILALVILRQLLFHNCNAVWTSGGRLYFQDFYTWVTFFSVPLNEIAKASVGSGGRMRPAGIVIQMKNGQQRFIPGHLLSEPPDIISSRLETLLSPS